MMEKDIIDIVTEKEYRDLTQEELDELKEFCSTEEEYTQLKAVFLSVGEIGVSELSPRAETKKSLDQLFNQTYPKASPVWYSSVLTLVVPKDKPIYRQPLLHIAAVVMLLLLVVPIMNSDVSPENKQLAKLEKVSKTKEAETQKIKVEDAEAVTNNLGQADLSMESRSSAEEGFAGSAPAESLDELSDMSIMAAAAPTSGLSTHPDGVFMSSDDAIAFSIPASESTDLLDLLTVAF